MDIAYIKAGFVPVMGCNIHTATKYIREVYKDFGSFVSFNEQENRFYVDTSPTKYFWEDNNLFIRRS